MKNSQNHCSCTKRLVGLGSEGGHTETNQDKVAIEQASQNLHSEDQNRRTVTRASCERENLNEEHT